jgi:uncharacterized membrane protein
MLASLRFASDLSPWGVIALAVAVAGLVAWYYLRETRDLASPLNYLLPSLRAAAVALVILILAGPVWHRRITVGTLGRVIVAVDTSQSMSIGDSQGAASTPSRLQRAVAMLGGDASDDGWIAKLQSTHEIDVVAFDSGSPSVVWSSSDAATDATTDAAERTSALLGSMQADGNRTDLSLSLEMLLAGAAKNRAGDDRADSQPDASSSLMQRSAVVIVSDGRDNVGRSAVDLAAPLKAGGATVHTIGMGSADEPPEAAILRVDRPDSVAADGRLAGEVVVHQSGMTDQPITVRIESANDNAVLWQKTITATDQRAQAIPFQLDVESIVAAMTDDDVRGVRRSTIVMDLRAVLEPIDGDQTLANNAMPFRVAATMRDRRLLILDGSSRWEMRYVRNLFERDPAWSVDTLLYGPGTDMPRIKRGDDPGQFPRSREAISRYDAIVLGEVPPDQFEAADANLIREFVTRGGGLIVIDGRYDRLSQLASTSLGDLIPVQFVVAPEIPVRAIEPTRIGRDHPMLNLSGDDESVDALWAQLPAPVSASRVEVLPGAESWADVIRVDQTRSPWLVTRLFGAGRVFYLSSDQTWRWRYKVADRFHARFWNQLLAAVMQPPYSASDDYVAIGTDRIEYPTGDSATIRARLQDAGGKPVGDATVDALLFSDNQLVATVPLSIDDPDRGTYRGTTAGLAQGAYDIRIRASGFDAAALQASTPIWVGDQSTVEMTRVSLDSQTLADIAASGGGIYVHESSAADVLDRLRPLSSGTIVESDVLIWQSFYWFWAVMLLLAVEWLLRKRAGLV